MKNNVGFVTDNGKTYYYDAMTHQAAKGWLNVGGKTYYMDPVTGAMKKAGSRSVDKTVITAGTVEEGR